ncbi:MAG: ferrous iron transport protein B [Ignavibacteria bacterium]|nr:ferrous iron transport protein B [Ignavibacteria bacterium]
MEFILAGQPNCGKSTIFNSVAGYKSIVSNFPGVTVEYLQSEIEISDRKFLLTDLPGNYAFQTADESEKCAIDYILNSSRDSIIINIIDSSVLSRSLEFTLQLMEFGKKIVVALNMTDEAEKKGIKIDEAKLSSILGVPVVKTIGKKGEGIFELFEKAVELSDKDKIPRTIRYNQLLESTIKMIEDIPSIKNKEFSISKRGIAINLIENNPIIKNFIGDVLTAEENQVLEDIVNNSSKFCDDSAGAAISGFRHNKSFEIFETVAKVGKPLKKDFRTKIDTLLLHPILGYIMMVIILVFSFWIVFKIGALTEPLFLDNIEKITEYLSLKIGENSVWFSVVNGFVEGFGGGVAIVIPYLFPFFVLLSVLEDTGYLSRIAFLTDNLFHKIGLHGMSVVPLVFGYGCTVPAILATRILKSPRDKFITATLTTLIPCSARMTVIFGIVGFFISVQAAIVLYVLNIVIIGLLGKMMSKAMPESGPGLIFEIPKYHLPQFGAVMKKTWLRLREFVIVALPLLIAGSIVLELIKQFELSDSINGFLSPFTNGLLGLPVAAGITLLFGIMRKELSLILLFAALGTQDISLVMTQTQMITYTVFITFYLPCLATFAAVAKELSTLKAVLITFFTLVLAFVLSICVRIIL